MSNNSKGTIWMNPAQFQVPKSDYAQSPTHVSFFGHVKASSRKMDGAPPDPALRWKGVDWSRPVWTPLPHKYARALSGAWKFSPNPPGNYWMNEVDTTTWDDVIVPAELMALGFDIKKDREYVYKRQLEIPEAWQGRTIILKVGMSYEYTKIWINGEFVRDHEGGFTSYECDITNYVTPGQTAWLTVMCMHRHDSLNDWPSAPELTLPGYAGIIDDVILTALPKNHLKRFIYDTDLDDAYTNAVLKVTAELAETGDFCELSLKLLDAENRNILPENTVIRLTQGNREGILKIPIANPLKWDAEHPNLYRLEAVLTAENETRLSYGLDVGFRKVERKGNNFYVNGIKTKLRGAALYGHDPILGKVFTREQLEAIVKAAKWANINFFRSSAYPERAVLYELCDKYGIYVEECCPANFQRGTWDSQNDEKIRPTTNMPAYTAYYMNQFSEMVERDRNHPSIIIWEYGNESDWGINLQAELDYLKKEEPTRLTAGTWDNSHTSLTSFHYPQYDEILPYASIYDEYAHVTTHNMHTLRLDPNIRNAWGLSVQKGWDALYEADGVVGVAIFAMGDYYIQRPGGEVFAASYGQWGLVDGWYREKPELWLTKKAFSPVKLPDKTVKKPMPGTPLAIWVKNRYSNTNLQDILFKWSVGEENGEFYGPNVAPAHAGAILMPARDWKDGEILSIAVYEKSGFLVDAYELTVGNDPAKKAFRKTTPEIPVTKETDHTIEISGKKFQVAFSKETGLITVGKFGEETLIQSGPYLNLHGAYYKPSVFRYDKDGVFVVKASGWKCSSISCNLENGEAVVQIVGTYPGGAHQDMWQFNYGYDPIHVDFKVRINGDGLITTSYRIANPPKEYVLECGISYILNDGIDRLTWEKESVFSAYPDDHIGRPKGVARRYRGFGKDTYRQAPQWPWSQDQTSFVLYGGQDHGDHGTNDFIATREDVYFASAGLAGKEERVRVEGDDLKVAVRLCPAKDEDADFTSGIKLTMNTELYYDIGNGSGAIIRSGDGFLGNYTYPEVKLEDGYSAAVQMRLTDTDSYDE